MRRGQFWAFGVRNILWSEEASCIVGAEVEDDDEDGGTMTASMSWRR